MPRKTAEPVDKFSGEKELLERVLVDAIEQRGEAFKVSPEGSLGLPKLLDEQRMRWQIPDGAFEDSAVFDRLLIYQVSDAAEFETWMKDGKIVRPVAYRAAAHCESAQGIIISAGLTAMDNLRSNGMDVGHHVWFNLNPVYQLKYCRTGEADSEHDRIASRSLLILRDADLVASKTLCQQLKGNDVRVDFKPNAEGYLEHRFVDENDIVWAPRNPEPTGGY